jgi:hypothetical protein
MLSDIKPNYDRQKKRNVCLIVKDLLLKSITNNKKREAIKASLKNKT